MSVGNNLQEMENVVTKNASPGDPMQKGPSGAKTPGNTAQIEDLGGPTPENYKTDDNSAKLNTPGKTLKQVRDVVNAKATPGDQAMPTMKKEEEEKPEDQVVSEEETTEEEIVAEEETSENEVVSEEETIENEVVAEEEALIAELNIEEDVAALFAGEELSEEFQEKAKTIFETTIKSKVSQITEELKNEFEQSLTEEIASIKEEIEDRADAYLEYVADEWLAENALSVEQGLKTEMTDSFLTGMKSLFEDHYVSIPEEKYDVLNSMVDKLDEMEGKLNEQIKNNVALNKRLAESSAEAIFAEATEGLALSQKDKLATLAENVEFDSEETYREKLVTLRKSYFPENAGVQRDNSENLSEGTEAPQAAPSGLMEGYLQTLSRVAKK
tara:strand:+ start:658 stop:1812 length:1155 start_codon:yes stop_codon:yes gene_type:complete